MAAVTFEIRKQDPGSRARLGMLHTPHGTLNTPAFAPVGTRGTVKAVTPRELTEASVELVMCNAYHLAIRPGADVVGRLGGLHRLAGWNGPLITDSGGFQVFSLSQRSEASEHGIRYRDPYDGLEREMTPESVIGVQESLGADLILPLDMCTPFPTSREVACRDAEMTLSWARRSADARSRGDQGLLAIVQGSVFGDLRRDCARDCAQLDVDGFAIGGVSVGESKSDMLGAISAAEPELPAERVRHLLGVGHPEDVVEAVALGMDTFDCVMPTRVARNGSALTMGGRVNVRNSASELDTGPLEPGCPCYACASFSRGALRHWLKVGEIIPLTLISIHNITFMTRLMSEIREHLERGTFSQFRIDFLQRYAGGAFSQTDPAALGSTL